MKQTLLFLLTIFTITTIIACNDDNKSLGESSTRGNIKIVADPSLQKVMDLQLKVWDSSYPEGHIKIEYNDEPKAFNRLLTDTSIRMIISTRDLTESERKAGESKKLKFRSLAIAQDGVAIIVNKESEDKKMTVPMLANIIEGNFPRKYNVIFDKENSSIVRFVQDSVLKGNKIPENNSFATENTAQVIDYVKNNKNALGIIGLDQLFTNNDSTGLPKFNADITVVALQAENDTTNDYYQPYPAYMALGYYPLKRNIYFISKEAWNGLGSGFANFLTLPAGQMIFKKSNMVPLRVSLEITEVKIN